jgi:hypothetical protein
MTFTSLLLREVDAQLTQGRDVRFVATRNHRSEEVRRREAAAAVGTRPLREMNDVIKALRAPSSYPAT